MPLRNIVQNKVIACSPETSCKDVAMMMKSNDVGAVLVQQNQEPTGIVTDRDLVLRCMSQGYEYTTPIEKVMTKGVVTVSVDDGIKDVIDCMKEHETRRVVVIDENKKAVGLLSFGDVFGLLAHELGELAAPASAIKAEAA